MPSFDIVSEIDAVELRNAVENSTRELASRFDFRNVDASFELKEETVKLAAEDDFQLGQMMDILRGNLAKRGVDARAMKAKDSVHIGKNWYKEAEFKQGLEALLAEENRQTDQRCQNQSASFDPRRQSTRHGQKAR